jgi:hypothetical protein
MLNSLITNTPLFYRALPYTTTSSIALTVGGHVTSQLRHSVIFPTSSDTPPVSMQSHRLSPLLATPISTRTHRHLDSLCTTLPPSAKPGLQSTNPQSRKPLPAYTRAYMSRSHVPCRAMVTIPLGARRRRSGGGHGGGCARRTVGTPSPPRGGRWKPRSRVMLGTVGSKRADNAIRGINSCRGSHVHRAN